MVTIRPDNDQAVSTVITGPSKRLYLASIRPDKNPFHRLSLIWRYIGPKLVTIDRYLVTKAPAHALSLRAHRSLRAATRLSQSPGWQRSATRSHNRGLGCYMTRYRAISRRSYGRYQRVATVISDKLLQRCYERFYEVFKARQWGLSTGAIHTRSQPLQ